MKEKKKDGEGSGRPRGSRKNIVGSESQGLLQAAAGSGFIGFSAFQTPAKVSTASAVLPEESGRNTAGSAPASGKAFAGGGDGGKRRVKLAKAGGGYSARSPGQQVLPPHYSGSDSHLAVVSKRLSKRDVTTKLKALTKLQSICRWPSLLVPPAPVPKPQPRPRAPCVRVSPLRLRAIFARGSRAVTGDKTQPAASSQPPAGPATTAEDLGELAPHWVFLYHRLSAEGDRRTREAANATLLCMLKANRRAFQPLMRSLMGPWWCSQADTAMEVSTSAREAFDAIFPGVKRASVLRRCAGGVLSHIDATLQQTPETLEEASGCTSEEAEKRVERLHVSALAALSNFLDAVGEEANSALCRPVDLVTGAADSVDAVQGRQDTASYRSVVNEGLWARLDDPRPVVRRAMYVLVSACCRHAPGLLRPPAPPFPAAAAPAASPSGPVETEEAAVTETEAVPVEVKKEKEKEKQKGRKGGGIASASGKRSRVAVPILLGGLLSEKEDSNHREAWQAVLLVLREFKQTWMGEKGAAAVLPSLLTRLRKGAFLPTSSTSYPSLLPFLASLPEQALLAPADVRSGGDPFCAALLESLWATITGTDGNTEGGGGTPGWLADVVSAHAECATFLLLKLPPPLGEGGPSRIVEGERGVAAVAVTVTADSAGGRSGEADAEQNSVAVSVSAATAHLAQAVRSLALDDEEGGAAGAGLAAGGVKRAGRESPVVGEAFSRALGQLHLGAEKGSGVMGSVSGSAAVWGALLREFTGALDQM
ncbi:unnamed protein product [Hapterophycus canaliculatus]